MLNSLLAFWPITYKIQQVCSFQEHVPNISFFFLFSIKGFVSFQQAFYSYRIYLRSLSVSPVVVQKHLKGLWMTFSPPLLDLCKRWYILHKWLASCPAQERDEAPATFPPVSVRRREREIFYPEEHELSCTDMLLLVAAVGRHAERSPMNNQEEPGKVSSSDKREFHLKSEPYKKTSKICI